MFMTLKEMKEVSKILLDNKLVEGDSTVIPEFVLRAKNRDALMYTFHLDNVMRSVYYVALKALFFETTRSRSTWDRFYSKESGAGLSPHVFRDYVREIAYVIGIDGERHKVTLV
jgi:hypothetical protein